MSTKFYIKNDNGNILSMDGKTRYTLLEGKAAYDFLKTEDGKRRCFHIEIEENGDKIGIETTQEFIKKYESDENHSAYLERQKAESGYEFISANIIVKDNETDVELIETIADVTVNVELQALQSMDLQNLRKALSKLSKTEYDLIYKLYLSPNTMTERQISAQTGIPQQTINCRRQAVLRKLRKFL